MTAVEIMFPAGFGGWNFNSNTIKAPKNKKNYQKNKKQRKEFLKWVNNNLVCRKVNSLEKDFRNGLVFVELIDCLGGGKVQSVVEDVLREENCLKNIFSVLHYLQDQGVCLPSVSAQELQNGDTRATMRLILALAAHYQPTRIVPRTPQHPPKEESHKNQQKSLVTTASKLQQKRASGNQTIPSKTAKNNTNAGSTEVEGVQEELFKQVAQLKHINTTLLNLLSAQEPQTTVAPFVTKDSTMASEPDVFKVVLNVSQSSSLRNGVSLNDLRDLLKRKQKTRYFVGSSSGEHGVIKELKDEDEAVCFDGGSVSIWLTTGSLS